MQAHLQLHYFRWKILSMAERRPPPNVDGMTTLKVDNISYRAT
jgi:hypothetical protein